MRTQRLFSLIAASLIPVTLAACSGGPVPTSGTSTPSEQPSSSAAPLTGVEMFRGLALAQGRGASLLGPAAQKLLTKGQSAAEFNTSFAELQRVARSRGATAEDLQKLDDFAKKVAAGEVTPESWATRASDIGDHVVAAITAKNPTFFDDFRAALTSGDRARIKDALADAARLSQENLPKESAAVKGPGTGIVIVVLAIIVVWVLVAVTQDPSQDSLEGDVMIDRLATDLAGH